MTELEPFLTIIIVNYETSFFTNNCIDSLDDQNIPWRAIIVDNPSEDEDWNQLPTGENITIIRNSENLGYGTACNIAASQADSRTTHLVILNPDTRVPPGALREWVEHHEAHQKSVPGTLFMSGPCLLNDNGLPQKSHYPFPSLFSYWATHSLLAGALKIPRKLAPINKSRKCESATDSRPREVDWITGAAIMMSPAAWESIGGFDPDFFLYFEDTDICIRMLKSGGKVMYLPALSIYHTQGDPQGDKRALGIIRLFSGYVLFLKKHYSKWEGRFIMLAIALDMAVRIVVYGTLQLVGYRNERNTARLKGYRAILALMMQETGIASIYGG